MVMLSLNFLKQFHFHRNVIISGKAFIDWPGFLVYTLEDKSGHTAEGERHPGRDSSRFWFGKAVL